MSMRFYVASKFSNKGQAAKVMEVLTSFGWHNTFDWTVDETQDPAPGLELAAHYESIATKEIAAVREAVVVFWLLEQGSHGSHVEVGVALGQGALVIALVEKLPDWHMIFFHHPNLVFLQLAPCEVFPVGLWQVLNGNLVKASKISGEFLELMGGVEQVDSPLGTYLQLVVLAMYAQRHALSKLALPKARFSVDVEAPPLPKIHRLKTANPSFSDILTGKKTFDLRQDDPARQFAVGDHLQLVELAEPPLVGRTTTRVISYIVRGPEYGFPPGYIAMGLEVLPPTPLSPKTTPTAPPTGRRVTCEVCGGSGKGKINTSAPENEPCDNCDGFGYYTLKT